MFKNLAHIFCSNLPGIRCPKTDKFDKSGAVRGGSVVDVVAEVVVIYYEVLNVTQ